MRYAEARNKIQSGDILAWTHKKWGSWYDWQVQAVRVFTQSEYCHVAVAWVFGGRVFVLESVGAGVRIFPLSHELPCYWVQTGVTWTPEVEELALAQIGAPYSKFRAIKDFLGIKEEYKIPHPWTCAEYTIYVEDALEFKLECDPTPSKVMQSCLHKDKTITLIEA